MSCSPQFVPPEISTCSPGADGGGAVAGKGGVTRRGEAGRAEGPRLGSGIADGQARVPWPGLSGEVLPDLKGVEDRGGRCRWV